VKGVRIVRNTVTVSVALASVAFLAGFVVNQRPIGLGLALGLVVGAMNGELIQRVIDSRSPFVISSLLRMAALSGVAIGVAFLVGASPVALLLGVGAAQFVMVGAAVRQGLRA
jgi:hypothetical protein